MKSLVIPELREHAPFDQLEPEALDYLAQKLRLAYHARGELILGPEDGVVDRLRIIKQGAVRGSGGPADVLLGPGEAFPLGALVGRRPTAYHYRAEADTFCWELAAPRFHELMEKSARWRAFATRHLALLLERSQRALRGEAAESALDSANMLAPLKSVLRHAAVSCAAGATLGEAIRRMHAERVGSIVVLDAQGLPGGIFTTVDLVASMAAAAPLGAPVSAHMTPRPVSLEEEATLADAALAMARHGFRHVVVTRDGKLAGVVSERDLFALQRLGLRRTAERIRGAQALPQLIEAAADIRGLTRHLLAQGVDAGPLTAMVSALNDALTRRVIELAAARRPLAGAWCWLALGSEGRMEQTLVTDQDNALIVEGEKAPFLAFADQVNRDLDACGFPLCKGDIMARNPRWCLTLPEWRRAFDDWIRNTDPEALMHAAIFFDFRPLGGEARLAGELRDGVLAQTRENRAFCRVLAQTRENRAFCRAMAQAALQARPPLGLLADFSADELDLKLAGARPFVDAARVLALGIGSAETGTAARLQAANEATSVEAFHYLQTLRLRRESNRVRVAELSDIERRVLKGAFRQASLLQQRLALDYGL